MTNIQFETITSFVNGLRQAKKEKVAKEIEYLIMQATQLADNLDSMKGKTESDYIQTSGLKLTIERLDTALAEMSALDAVKDAQSRIEKKFPQDEVKELEVLEELKLEKFYWYSYRLRGFSLGCQPKDFVDHRGDVGRFGIVGYKRPLTEKEITDFELESYGTETYVTKMYDTPKCAKTTHGYPIELIGEQTGTMLDGSEEEKYLYYVINGNPPNYKPFASLKTNVIIEGEK